MEAQRERSTELPATPRREEEMNRYSVPIAAFLDRFFNQRISSVPCRPPLECVLLLAATRFATKAAELKRNSLSSPPPSERSTPSRLKRIARCHRRGGGFRDDPARQRPGASVDPGAAQSSLGKVVAASRPVAVSALVTVSPCVCLWRSKARLFTASIV